MLEQEQVEAMAELVAKKLIDLGVIPPPSRTMRYELTQEQIERFKAHANGTVRGSKVGTQQIAEVFLGDTIEESQVMEVVLTLLDNLVRAWDLAERAVSNAERSANNFGLLQAKMQLEEIKGKLNG